MSSRRLTLLLVVFAMALGAWLRLRGISFGLPAVYNPDEVSIMSRALGFASGDLNPHNFLYPTLYFYFLFAWIGAYFVGAWIFGVMPSVAAFQQSFFLDPTGIYVAGRLLSMACGVATVAGVWRLGTRIWSPTAGVAAAFFLAVAPFAVRDAHYVKHDVPTTTVLVATLIAVVSLAEAPAAERVRRLWIAALLAGLATSMHYYAVFVGVPVAIGVWLAWSDRAADSTQRLVRVAQAAAIAAFAFVLGSPFLVVEPLTAVRDIRANRQIVIDRAVEGASRWLPSAADYARMLATEAVGWPIALLAVIGIVALARARPRIMWLLLSFPLVFLLFLSNTVAATRYLNPVLPLVAILAGIGLSSLSSMWRRGVSPAGVRPASAAALALVAALAAWPALAASIHTGTFFRQEDTRSLALEFLRAHVPEGATVLVQPYSVPLAQSREGLVEALTAHLGDPSRASQKFQMQLALPEWPHPTYRVLYLGRGGLDVDKIYVDYADLCGTAGLSALRRSRVQYVILKRYNDESALMAPLVDALGRDGRRLHVVTPYRPSTRGVGVEPFLHNTDARLDAALARPGPVIEIWQLQ
jgi:hypothetical protein